MSGLLELKKPQLLVRIQELVAELGKFTAQEANIVNQNVIVIEYSSLSELKKLERYRLLAVFLECILNYGDYTRNNIPQNISDTLTERFYEAIKTPSITVDSFYGEVIKHLQ